MILNFPDLDTIRLALTAGAVPAAAALAPTVAGFDDDGRVWVEPSADLPKKAQAELRRLGVGIGKVAGASPAVEMSCWLELLPLQRSADPVVRPEQTPILFELAEGEQFSSLVSEVLRLGNDRQGFRWLEDPRGKSPGRALLRVVGPPYYSLLRAIDRDGQASAPTAYVEQAPRVWVQLGYRHPLGEQLKPPQGKLLLLKPPRRWTCVEDVPFRDIYEVLEFTLPAQKVRWREGELGRRLTVPLRLTRGGTGDAAELWVLRDNPIDQLDDLVREADNTLLDRLAFAVGEKGGEKTIVLRVRPSKQPPPALALSAVEFCHFQKMPNLFLPVGRRLHPPLRRDAVRKHLAEDPMQVTWLYPDAAGGFTPESLPETAFRPLSDWIDYVLEHDHEPLQAWIESARFDFEQFVCDEDGGDRPNKPPREPRVKAPPRSPESRMGEGKGQRRNNNGDADEAGEAASKDDVFAAVVAAPPDELRQHLSDLEARFLAAEGGLDAADRQALWPELAALNARLGSGDDTGVCWMNALWLRDEAQAARALNWFRAEAQGVKVRKEAGWPNGRTWASAAALAPRGAAVEGADLDLVLSLDEPQTADVRALAAYVFWASCRKEPAAALAQRLGKVAHFLETKGHLIPVRAAWLAALGLHRLAGEDALGLARARDRLLERLFHTGLRPEQDLPSFLRFSGPAGNQRFRAVRQWLATLADLAQKWIQENTPTGGSAKTSGYADLMFAFGLARLGERDASNQLRQRASSTLAGQGSTHALLLDGFGYRIHEAQDRKPHTGPLPVEWMERLFRIYQGRRPRGESQSDTSWYAIDRLRQRSRILEPDQKIEPYRYHQESQRDELKRDLLRLPDVLDRLEAAELVRRSLQRPWEGEEGIRLRAHVLCTALDQAPRIGADFATEMLAMTPAAFDALPAATTLTDFQDQFRLLEKGLFVAAHFDRADHVQHFIARVRRVLQTPYAKPMMEALDSLAREALRALRKLGRHKESNQLLD